MMGLGLCLAIEKVASSGASPPTVAPANTVLPAISGTPIVPNILSVSTGTWTGYPSPTFTYQWLRDGATIVAATASLYSLVVADAAHSVSAQVTATNIAGTVSATSNTVIPTKTTLSYTPVTSATQDSPYTGATPSTSGGTASYLYSISAGTLPAGTSLATGTGIISGTPTVATAYSGIVLTVTDANGITDSSSPFTITVSGGSPAPDNAYVAEDGTTYYVAEDGTTYYVQETASVGGNQSTPGTLIGGV